MLSTNALLYLLIGILTGVIGSLCLSLYFFSSLANHPSESMPKKAPKVIEVEENENENAFSPQHKEGSSGAIIETFEDTEGGGPTKPSIQ